MASTPLRAVRVPTELWVAVRDKTEAEETTISAVIVTALEAYAAK